MSDLGWLEDTGDGHRIQKVDAWEAMDPRPVMLPPAEQFAAQIVGFTDALANRIEAQITGFGRGAQVAALAALLRDLRRARATLGFLESEAETALAGAMPARVVELPGMVLERHSGRKRTNWDHDRLLSIVVARVPADPDTGELLSDAAQAAITAEVRACAGISYWKVGELRARELDPAVFCDEEAGRPTVHIREAG
jgi:hypothetical protein